MLKHSDVWRGIDRLAELRGLSTSGLARAAGLCPTTFNRSKRVQGARERWPSTESLAAILAATETDLATFVGLMTDAPQGANAPSAAVEIPLLPLTTPFKKGAFDAKGKPVGDFWEKLPVPSAQDPRAFALEITDKRYEPLYRAGDKIILSPQTQPRRGDKVAIRTRDGALLLCQLGREGSQKIEILSANPDEAPQTLARNSVVWMYRILWATQ